MKNNINSSTEINKAQPEDLPLIVNKAVNFDVHDDINLMLERSNVLVRILLDDCDMSKGNERQINITFMLSELIGELKPKLDTLY
jgi:hypothetical protein